MPEGAAQGEQGSIKPIVDEIEKLEAHLRSPGLVEADDDQRASLMDVLGAVKTILKAQCRKKGKYVYFPLDSRDNPNTPRR